MLEERLSSGASCLAVVTPSGHGSTFDELIGTLRKVIQWWSSGPASLRVVSVLPDAPTTALAVLAATEVVAIAPANPAASRAELEALIGAFGADALLLEVISPDLLELAVRHNLGVAMLHPRPDRHCADFDLIWQRMPEERSRAVAEPSLVLQTSGSTGTPKLVPLELPKLVASADNIADTLRLDETDTCVHALPMFHIGAFVDLMLAPLFRRGRVCFAHPMSTEGTLTAIESCQATWLQAVPTMLHDMLQSVSQDDLLETGRSLRFIRCVGAPLAPGREREIEKSFGGVPVIQMYGMTETAGQICSNPLPPGMRKPGSVGLPRGPEVVVLDRYGNPVPPGSRGEVCVRGPTVMQGYLGARSRKHTFGEWLRTGDLGHFDGDGYLILDGRLKDIINRGGEKIAAFEIERVVIGLPGVREAACVALPHPSLGEDIGLVVVTETGAPEAPAQLQSQLREHLAAHKVPRVIRFASELPRLAGGKVDKRSVTTLLLETGNPAPRSDTQLDALGRKIAKVWARTLGVERPTPDDDFFEAGGDSLSAQTFMLELERTFDRTLPTNLLFEHPTLAALAEALKTTESEADSMTPTSGLPAAVFDAARRGMAGWRGQRLRSNSLIVALRSIGTRTPFFFCTPTEDSFSALWQQLDSQRPFYAMRTLWLQDARTPENEQLLAEHYAHEICEIQPTGGLLIGGHCRGVEMVRDIIRALEARGRHIALLVELDHYVDDFYGGPVAQVWSDQHTLKHLFTEPERWLAYHYSEPVLRTHIPTTHMLVTRGENAAAIAAFLDPLLDEAEERHGKQPPVPSRDVAELRARLELRRTQLHVGDVEIACPRFGTHRELVPVKAIVTNTGHETWGPSDKSGIRLAARWQRLSGTLVAGLAGAADLPCAVAPGERLDVRFEIPFHRHTSPMYLVVDLVDEGVGWFHAHDGKAARQLMLPRYWRGRRSTPSSVAEGPAPASEGSNLG